MNPGRYQGGGSAATSRRLTKMEPINLLYCIDRSADNSNRRSYLLLRRQAPPGQYRLLQSGEISRNACPSFSVAGQFPRHRSCNRRSSARPRNSAHPSSALRHIWLPINTNSWRKSSASRDQWPECRARYLPVLDAKSSRNRPHLGHAAFVCFDLRSD